MSYTRDTPLRGTTNVSVEQAIAYAASLGAKGPYRQYLRFCWKWAPGLGLNPLAVMAQWCDETSTLIDGVLIPGTSERWLDGDPAGIGIFSDDTVSTLPSGLSGDQSAAIQLVELYTKLNRRLPPSSLVDDINVWLIDPHLNRVMEFVRRSDWPAIRTLYDLRIPLAGNDFTWAANQQYGAQIAQHMNRIEQFAHSESQNQEEPPMAALIYRQAKHPPFIDRLIPDSQNRAWNNLGQRRIVGTCRHTEVGTNEGTDGWFRRGAASTGLTDYGVSLAGIILRWNDPTGAAHPGVSANRAGWANGGSDGLEGDGPLFVRTRGIDAINRDLVSIEREDLGDPYDTAFEGLQFEAIAQLTCYWHDQADVPWERFPFNPNIGCVTDFHHLEFATKGCPHDPVTSKVNQFQDRVRALLQAAQTATDGVPTVPIPVPVEVDHGAWPNGWKEADLAARWAAPRYVDLAGKRKALRFQPNGPLPNAWVARGVAEGITRIADLPKCVRIVEVAAPDSGMVSAMAIFDGRGTDNWAAYRPAAHVAWRWVQ